MLRIFSALKNPTASAGCEPANLGTKGQHATSRPLKPLRSCISRSIPNIYHLPLLPLQMKSKGMYFAPWHLLITTYKNQNLTTQNDNNEQLHYKSTEFSFQNERHHQCNTGPVSFRGLLLSPLLRPSSHIIRDCTYVQLCHKLILQNI